MNAGSSPRDNLIGVTGASGFVGGEICRQLAAAGFGVAGFSRNAGRAIPGCREVREFSLQSTPDFRGLAGVIHLAGEPILGLWTAAKKKRILESRVLGTAAVVRGIRSNPGLSLGLVTASAIGFYGDTGDTSATEDSPPGTGFLAGVVRSWENEALCAEEAGVRVARIRIGMVLGNGGGAMPLLKPVFSLGLGGRLGSGTQWMSPIHVCDLAALFLFVLQNPALSGAFNAVLPTSINNREFTKALAAALKRPAIFPVPSFALRLALGELSTVLLQSARVAPAKTLQAGFQFGFPDIHSTFKDLTTSR